jgi:hypothetical protein
MAELSLVEERNDGRVLLASLTRSTLNLTCAGGLWGCVCGTERWCSKLTTGNRAIFTGKTRTCQTKEEIWSVLKSHWVDGTIRFKMMAQSGIFANNTSAYHK